MTSGTSDFAGSPDDLIAAQEIPGTAMVHPQSAADAHRDTARPVEADEALDIVETGIRRWLEDRRERIPTFVDETYSWGAALRTHRLAVGWDLVRAPLNLALAVPQVGVMATAEGMKLAARRMPHLEDRATRLARVNVMLPTNVGRELTFRMYRDFLELPVSDGPDRMSDKDALTDAIFSDPRVAGMEQAVNDTIASHYGDGMFRDKLVNALQVYVGSRSAAADIATSMGCITVGTFAAGRFTPGALSLSAALAGEFAKNSAIAGFPLGRGLGSVWYGSGAGSVQIPLATWIGSGALVLGAVALVGAFSGIITDPVQRSLGLHKRRLNRMVTTLEKDLIGAGDTPLVLRDHYVARILDLADLVVTISQLSSKN